MSPPVSSFGAVMKLICTMLSVLSVPYLQLRVALLWVNVGSLSANPTSDATCEVFGHSFGTAERVCDVDSEEVVVFEPDLVAPWSAGATDALGVLPAETAPPGSAPPGSTPAEHAVSIPVNAAMQEIRTIAGAAFVMSRG
jgi:hypothetical protein